MKILFSILLILLVGCKKQEAPSAVDPVETPPVATNPSLIHDGIRFKCDEKCTAVEVQRLAAAQKLANEMIHSPCFEKFWLARKLDPVQTKNKTNAELLLQLRTTIFEAPVEYYYSWKSTIGYRDPGNPKIHFNRKYHDGFNECNTVSNGVHEWTHSALEWEHDYKDTARRPYSGPYSVNAGADKCCFKNKILE